MGLLAGGAYDPAVAVTKATTALLAATALDTTNLRRVFVGPANGAVEVRMLGVLHGGSASPWFPSILFAVLEGSTVRGRQAPAGGAPGVVGSATMLLPVEAVFPVTGLTPGTTYTWDAAYSVETAQAGSALKYGGPNDASANNAFGAFIFEIWSTA